MEEATRTAFGKALTEFAEEFPELVTVDADLAGSTKTKDFAQKHPTRAFNVGISEQDLIGTAAGLAIAGFRPFACSFAMFATGRAWEQIRNTVCTSHLPVCIVGSHAGILTGEDGETHQSLEDVALLRSLPPMKIFSPADSVETRAFVYHILKNEKGPCYLRLGRENVPVIFPANEVFDIGKVRVLATGTDLTIFATGPVVHAALAAATKLAVQGVSATVVNVSVLKPLDSAGVIAELKKTKKCITAEDHSIIGGLGSAVAEIIAENGLETRLLRIGMKTFGESGTPLDLYEKYGFDADGIMDRALAFVKPPANNSLDDDNKGGDDDAF